MQLNPQLIANKFGISVPKAEKLLSRYMNAIASEGVSRCTYFGHEHQNTVFVSLDAIRLKCESFHVNKIRYSVFNELNAIYAQVIDIKKGNNMGTGTLSEVIIGREVLDAIADLSPERVFNAMYPDINSATEDEYDLININRESLAEFINYERRRLDGSLSNSFRTALQDQLVKAKAILLVAEHTDGVLPHKIIRSKFGPDARKYYSGLNLHNCPKRVREAALGRCYQVDFNVAAYALMLDLVYRIAISDDKKNKHEIEELLNSEFSYTQEYISNRTSHRERLAKLAFYQNDRWILQGREDEALKLIKTAISAIGFGANGKKGSWMSTAGVRQYSAISSLIYNEEAYTNFINDQMIANLLLEQSKIREYILTSEYSKKYQPQFDAIKQSTGRKPNESQMLSCIYQTEERRFLDIAIAECEKQGATVLLEVHDALYLDKRVSLTDLAVALRYADNTLPNRFVNVTGQYVGHSGEVILTAHDQDVLDHWARIKEAEDNAKQMPSVGPWADNNRTIVKREVNLDEDWANYCREINGYQPDNYDKPNYQD